ncbi:conserved hypothetical protein [Burkholderia pseudomallei MSHR346]|nr:conserved hypothetical protein [Burkholderia pseudomallei MSHR346]
MSVAPVRVKRAGRSGCGLEAVSKRSRSDQASRATTVAPTQRTQPAQRRTRSWRRSILRLNGQRMRPIRPTPVQSTGGGGGASLGTGRGQRATIDKPIHIRR